MQITASTFTDPLLRPQLEAYYDKKKNDLFESLKARETANLPQEVKYTDANGETHTAKLIPVSAEKMIAALVPFEKWAEFQAESFSDTGIGRMRFAKSDTEGAAEWQKQWQANMNDIRAFLLSLQENPTT